MIDTPAFSPTALSVLEKRYLLKDDSGKAIETPLQLFRRVATALGAGEVETEEFFQLMVNLDFLPNSPTLMNAGTELGMLSACFVVPVGDSIDEIFDGIKHAALIHKAGGGVGYSFSKLRPANDVVASTSGVSSGPISFMTVYDAATETIKQGGRRRGANMGILHVNHPDIETFISCKNDLSRLNNFNISVSLTDAFMEAVENDSSIPLTNPRTGEVVKQISARQLFSTIAENAHLTGEPGIVFIDAINRANPTPYLGTIESTNPCGEQPLLPYESCNLGSINLSNFVSNSGKIDYTRLRKVIEIAVRFLDAVIENNRFPLHEIAIATRTTRKIGLGVMGFADMLIKMRIPYTSRKALNLAEEVMGFVHTTAREVSQGLAAIHGAYPGWNSLDTNFYRHATVTTIAPTGTISILAGCSSGIEPLYALAFKRRILGGEEFHEIHPLVEMVLKPHLSRYKWEKFSEAIYETGKITEEINSRFNISEIINPEVFVIAHDVPAEWHLKMQAAFQKFTDNAVSKTINLPKETSPKEIERIYKTAWKLGLKGVTIYRDGSRQGQTLSTGRTQIKRLTPRERPEITQGMAQMIQTGCGKMFVIPAHDEDGLCETFINLGKTGACAASQLEAQGRLISLALRCGVGIEDIVRQLSGIRCPNPCWHRGVQVLSCSDGVAKVLAQQMNLKVEQVDTTPVLCPDCGNTITPEGGCETCLSCGWSRCK